MKWQDTSDEEANRRKGMRRAEDRELQMVAQEALETANRAYGKWENHEELCAERYKRLDSNVTRLTLLLITTLLAVAGTFGTVLLNMALAKHP